MNDVQHFLQQQAGRKKWLSYDSCLHRLRCLREEDFNQIMSSDVEEGYPETPIFACKFAQKQGYEHMLALANEEGELAVCDTLMKEDRTGIRAHHNAIFDLAWMHKEMKVVTVSGDHTARLLDLTSDGLNTVQMFSGHSMSVKTVSFRRNDFWVFSTGSRDGSIMIWDIRTNNSSTTVFPDNKIENSHAVKRTRTPNRRYGTSYLQTCVSGANSVTGLIFQNDDTLISCGAGDGMIKFWDLRKTYIVSKRVPVPKHVIPYSGMTLRHGFSNLLLDENCVKLYASCLDNSIYCYNIASYNTRPVMSYTGHQNRTYYVKACLSRDGRYLLSGSSDHFSYIWNVANPNPIAKLRGHTAEVTCVDWCPNNLTIVTCSDDMTHKFWRLGPENKPDNWEVTGAGDAVPLSQPKNNKRPKDTQKSPKKRKICDKCELAETTCEKCNHSPKARKRLHLDSSGGPLAKKAHISKDFAPSFAGIRTIVEEDIDETVSVKKNSISARENSSFVKQVLVSVKEDATVIEEPSRRENANGRENADERREETVFSNEGSAITEEKDVFKRKAVSSPNKEELLSTHDSFATHDRLSTNHDRLTTKQMEPQGVGTPRTNVCRLGLLEVIDSPTSNLPNFVVDGSAPHLNYSPKKKVDPDWLTKMSTEKRIRRRMQELSSNEASSPPKASKVDTTPKSSHKTPRRRVTEHPKSPLLRFFKITNSSTVKDAQCSPTSSRSTSAMQRSNYESL